MTTRATKPVAREIDTPRGTMIVTLTNAGVIVRRKGSRTSLGPVPITTIEDVAAKMDAAARGHAVPAPRPRRSKTGAR